MRPARSRASPENSEPTASSSVHDAATSATSLALEPHPDAPAEDVVLVGDRQLDQRADEVRGLRRRAIAKSPLGRDDARAARARPRACGGSPRGSPARTSRISSSWYAPAEVHVYPTAALRRSSAAAPYAARYRSQRCGIFGAASRMNSTGAGGRGGWRSSMCTSCGRRLPLRRLHGAQEVTTFSQTDSPPFERGTTWSSVSRPLGGAAVDAAPAVTREERAARDLALDDPRDADVGEEPDHVRPRELSLRPSAVVGRALRPPPPCPCRRARAPAATSTR